MTEQPRRNFYVGLFKDGTEYVGHGYSFNPDNLAVSPTDEERNAALVPPPSGMNFQAVFVSFVTVMETYRKFIPLVLGLAPLVSSSIARQQVGKFAKDKGRLRTDLSNEKVEIYELNIVAYRQFAIYHDEVATAMDGARHLPEVMIIGLVSAYDAFLSQLLRVVLSKHPEIVLTSEKTIKFSELSSFESIESVRIAIIDREIEAVLRASHHEQFDWMENTFSMKLREELSIWHKFVELCERRNLLTHTGGVVSKQYIDICKKHKCETVDTSIGKRLSVDSQYFADAVKTIYEIGTKLSYVLWRKFATAEHETADRRVNELGYDLIYRRAYDIAEPILRFGAEVVKTYKGNESTRRMMIVNLANAVRLQERKGDAEKLLDKEDWSACSDEFQVCVAAVKENVGDVLTIMRRIGPAGLPNMEGDRTWPVFRGVRTDERFMTVFEDVFGEPVIGVSTQQQEGAAELSIAAPSPTKH